MLFTGARAPIVAYMARLLVQAGYEVYAADSTYASVCVASRFVHKFIKLPKPTNPNYKDTLCKIVQKYQIDYIIPTCEEIFYIAQFRQELSQYTRLFCEQSPKLIALHDKWSFYNYLRKGGLKTPATQLADQAEKAWEQPHIIKPRFSRFASKVRCETKLPKTRADNRHIVQAFINGKQICSYALCKEGKVLAQCVYESVLTAGRGAGILLKRISHPQAEEITARISRDFGFTGQIAFDFIETNNNELYVIECNPRATNGLGFLGTDFVRLLSNERTVKKDNPSVLVSRLAVWCYGILQPIKTVQARKLFVGAVDFVSFKQDPLAWLAQIPIVIWWLLKGLWYGGPTAASTVDIEFNGTNFL